MLAFVADRLYFVGVLMGYLMLAIADFSVPPIVPRVLSILALSVTTAAEVAPPQVCPIVKSIYRDGDGKGFQLIFSPPPHNTPYHATAVINHVQQGQIYRFSVFQTSGYGDIWLIDRSARDPQKAKWLWIGFFDRNFKFATPLWLEQTTESPQYAIVAGLGSFDRDRRRGTESPPLMRDPMWIFDRCQ